MPRLCVCVCVYKNTILYRKARMGLRVAQCEGTLCIALIPEKG